MFTSFLDDDARLSLSLLYLVRK